MVAPSEFMAMTAPEIHDGEIKQPGISHSIERAVKTEGNREHGPGRRGKGNAAVLSAVPQYVRGEEHVTIYHDTPQSSTPGSHWPLKAEDISRQALSQHSAPTQTYIHQPTPLKAAVEQKPITVLPSHGVDPVTAPPVSHKGSAEGMERSFSPPMMQWDGSRLVFFTINFFYYHYYY